MFISIENSFWEFFQQDFYGLYIVAICCIIHGGTFQNKIEVNNKKGTVKPWTDVIWQVLLWIIKRHAALTAAAAS